MHRWCVSSTIIGATSMTQLQENIGAYQVKLSHEVLVEIEKIHLSAPNPAP
jgi:aryl-alcohol dehydrogenase-like predicted oxidoreductase